jgi:hypothetical protein
MNLRVKLVKTRRTDVMCVSCGSFHADHVIVLTTGVETDSGIHKKCVDTTAVRFTRKKKSVPEIEVEETGT